MCLLGAQPVSELSSDTSQTQKETGYLSPETPVPYLIASEDTPE